MIVLTGWYKNTPRSLFIKSVTETDLSFLDNVDSPTAMKI